ncbi:MAG: hypothetical protein QOD57_1352, partial [Actinomycetota bacterium]|nr:hypothetical protein [Actinomycetota bacterium]
SARLRGVVETAGPDAVGSYFGSLSGWDPCGRAVAETLHHRLGSRSRYTSTTIDCPAKPLVAQLVLGHAAISPLPDLDGARLALLLGTNPVVSHGHTWALPDPVVALRTVAGREGVWVVDSRRTETARLATRHLAPRPGTDHFLLGYLIRELLIDGADQPYLDRYTTGQPVLKQAVVRFTTACTTEATGLGVEELTDLCAAVRRAGRLSVLTGTGLTMGATANLTEWLVAALMLVTGSLDQPGGMWCNPGLLARLDEAGIDARKSKPAQAGPPSRPELPRRFGQYPCAAMADEIESGHLRALFSLAGNPLVSFPEPEHLRRAFARLEVLAVADVRRTETAEWATHVLPCAGPFERADATIGAELYQPLVAAQYAPAMVMPVGQRKPLWWILGQVGRRLGHRVLPGGLDPDTATDDDVLDAVAGAGRMAALRAAPSGLTGDGSRFGWILGMADRPPFDLAPPELVAELDRAEPAAPLVLTPRRQVRHVNSWFPPPETRQDELSVLLHPHDAAEAGVSDGDRVLVRTRAGAIEGVATVSDGVRRGTVSIPHGFEGRAGPNVSRLISSHTDVDGLTGMVLKSGVPVTIERAG